MVKENVRVIKNFIKDKWIESSGTEMEVVPNPATGEIIAKVP